MMKYPRLYDFERKFKASVIPGEALIGIHHHNFYTKFCKQE